MDASPVADASPVTLVAQEANVNRDTFLAALESELPPLDLKFAWGVITIQC